ncbi:MAG: hypothetical protein U5K81_00295 [Trueperaceae bacterium]|nr:hypothetical protein [Trueperaceae bacterium]
MNAHPHRDVAPGARLAWTATLLTLTLLLAGLAAAEGPVPAPSDALARTVAGWGGDDDDGYDEGYDDDEPFHLDDSATDLNVFAMDCFYPDSDFFTWSADAYASTVANRSAYYLAADVKLYANGVLRNQTFEDSYGPISAISASVSYSAPCQEYEEYSLRADGWHKGIENAGDFPEYDETYDR